MDPTAKDKEPEVPVPPEDDDIQELIGPMVTVPSGKSWIRKFYFHDKNKSTYICNLCR